MNLEYSIHELSKIAKVSTRTLRYYHEINLLYPKRTNSSGYRIYGEKEVDLLIENVEKTISYKKGRLICQIKKNLKLSKKWLEYSWNFYSKEAHRNLGEMYVLDERFKKYYDNNQEGMAEFFRDALNIYTK